MTKFIDTCGCQWNLPRRHGKQPRNFAKGRVVIPCPGHEGWLRGALFTQRSRDKNTRDHQCECVWVTNDGKDRVIEPCDAHKRWLGEVDEERRQDGTLGEPQLLHHPVVFEIDGERHRQIIREGFDENNDDRWMAGELADAAACYARGEQLPFWPFDADWWKPKDRRRNLIRSAALLVAEIERVDRVQERIDKTGYGTQTVLETRSWEDYQSDEERRLKSQLAEAQDSLAAVRQQEEWSKNENIRLRKKLGLAVQVVAFFGERAYWEKVVETPGAPGVWSMRLVKDEPWRYATRMLDIIGPDGDYDDSFATALLDIDVMREESEKRNAALRHYANRSLWDKRLLRFTDRPATRWWGIKDVEEPWAVAEKALGGMETAVYVGARGGGKTGAVSGVDSISTEERWDLVAEELGLRTSVVLTSPNWGILENAADRFRLEGADILGLLEGVLFSPRLGPGEMTEEEKLRQRWKNVSQDLELQYRGHEGTDTWRGVGESGERLECHFPDLLPVMEQIAAMRREPTPEPDPDFDEVE